MGKGGARVAFSHESQGVRIRFKLVNITPAFISPDTCPLLSPPRLGPLPQCGAAEGPPQVQSSGGADRGLSCTWAAVPLLPLHSPVSFTSPKVLTVPRNVSDFLFVNFYYKICLLEPDLRHYISIKCHRFQSCYKAHLRHSQHTESGEK